MFFTLDKAVIPTAMVSPPLKDLFCYGNKVQCVRNCRQSHVHTVSQFLSDLRQRFRSDTMDLIPECLLGPLYWLGLTNTRHC